MVKIAVLVSGGGTNLQALIDAEQSGGICGGKIEAVISSKAGVYALERAEKAGIKGYVLSKKAYPDKEEYSRELLSLLKELGIDLVVLAGFLVVLSEEFTREYRNRIINVHPSLIPAFCGDGYYGLKVHEAALAYGVKYTGATVHFVNEETDGGPIILQQPVEILPDDTPETLQHRVMEKAEWIILPKAVALFCEGKLMVKGRIVEIKD